MTGPGTDSAAKGMCLAGRYRLSEMIGSGGAGTVWAAVDEVLGRRVAVKDVGAPRWLSMESRDAVRERTLREARAAALIDHPNVVTVYDVVEVDDRPWIVMELVEARSLSELIDDVGPLSPEDTAQIGLRVLGALRAAHEHGILHRDVKPSNVLVDDDGRVVLADFGIASIEGDVELTASGVLVGAPAFIAPERVQTGQGPPAGPASDLWSLGATLYTAVEGRPPYQREGAICTIAAVVHDEPDRTERAGPLEPVLTALLRRDPEERPSAGEVEAMLRDVVAGRPVTVPPVAARDGADAASADGDSADGAGVAAAGLTGAAGLAAAAGMVDDDDVTALHQKPASAGDEPAGAWTTQATSTPAAAGVPAAAAASTPAAAGLANGEGATTTVLTPPAQPEPEPGRARTVILLSAAGLLAAVLLTGVLTQVYGGQGAPTDQPAGEPAVSTQQVPGQAPVVPNSGGGGGESAPDPAGGNVPDQVDPVAGVSSDPTATRSSQVPTGAPTSTNAGPGPTTTVQPEPTTETTEPEPTGSTGPSEPTEPSETTEENPPPPTGADTAP